MTSNDSYVAAVPSVAVVQDRAVLSYPSAEYCFSPDERYPEYPFAELSPQSNAVYRMVRNLLRDAGLDRDNFGAPSWNPLGDWVRHGQRVFCLVNFVTNRRPWQNADDALGMLTHASVIRAVLDYLVIATGRADLVAFGNAPVQGARRAELMNETCAEAVQRFYITETGWNPGPRDLRLYTADVSFWGYMRKASVSEVEDDVAINLGPNSLLDALPDEAFRRFRISDYGSQANHSFHARSRHIYKVNRAVIDADVIFHIPKLKPHGKVGLTCALKGAVGAISRKECLAHHQVGAPSEGGDEFPQNSLLTNVYKSLGDLRDESRSLRQNAIRTAHTNLGRVLDRLFQVDLKGGWHGNDTAWRMALDINRCLLYGKADGSLSATPVRKLVSLVDGIIAGEGEGPIHVKGRPFGTLILAEDAAAGDAVAALAIGFDPARIPLIREAFRPGPYSLTLASWGHTAVSLNGAAVDARNLPQRLGSYFRPPRGWKHHIELDTTGEYVEPHETFV